MRTTTITAIFLISFGLVGCIAPDDGSLMENLRNTEPATSVRDPKTLTFSGTLAADACTDSQHVDTCDAPLHSAFPGKSPPSHTVWHEVEIEKKLEGLSVVADWEWEEPGSATFYVALELHDKIVAQTIGETPSIHLTDVAMDGFDPQDHRLWLYFGVKPEEDSIGRHFPRVNVDYAIAVHLDGAK